LIDNSAEIRYFGAGALKTDPQTFLLSANPFIRDR